MYSDTQPQTMIAWQGESWGTQYPNVPSSCPQFPSSSRDPHWLKPESTESVNAVYSGQPPGKRNRVERTQSSSEGQMENPQLLSLVCRPTRITKALECQVLAFAVFDSSPHLLPPLKGQNLNRPSGVLCSLGPHCKPLPWLSLYSLGCQGRGTRPGKELDPLIHLGICNSASSWASRPSSNHGQGQWVFNRLGIQLSELQKFIPVGILHTLELKPPGGRKGDKQ